MVTTPRPIDALVIGGSAGALEVLMTVLPALPRDLSAAVVIVLHLAPHKPSYLRDVLSQRTALAVREPDDKEPMLPGTVYVGPPNYHLLIERNRTLALSVDDAVNFSRPSIDVLFESAAEALGPSVAGVLLTGANDDGARGLARIRASGGITVVQSPETASASAMPEAGIRAAAIDHVLPPERIGPLLVELAKRSGGSR